MKFRRRIAMVLTSATVATTAGTIAAATQPSNGADGTQPGARGRPNIVFVLTDDLSMNLVDHMPHVQAMLDSGTSFENYFVTDSLCCPSRASILTGDLPHNTGVFGNAGKDGGYDAFNRNGNETKSFAVAMQRAGYRTALMGKYLNQYEPDDDAPAPGWDEWDVAGHAYKEFNYTLNENGTAHTYGSAPANYLTDVLSGKAQDFVAAAARDDKPFMLEVAPFAPHAPYVPAPRYADAVPDLHAPHTPAYNALPTNAPTWLKDLPSLDADDDAALDEIYRRRVRADLAVDDLIAGLQSTLRSAGIADDTYVVFSSDNGLHLGDHRLWAGKRTAFDTDIHVPLVITGPGVAAGRTVSDLVSNVDLAPTFAEIAGTGKRSATDGVSVLGLIHGNRPDRWQRALLVEHHRSGAATGDPDAQPTESGDPPDYEALRTPTALLVHYTEADEYEYYNVRTDPWELHNVPDRAPDDLKAELEALSTCSGEGCRRDAR